MSAIHDHGELDFLTPPEPTDVDRAIADAARLAMAEQRYYLNTRDKLRQSREMTAGEQMHEARIRVLGAACRIARAKGDKAGERSLWADYRKAHAARSPEVVAEMERRMGVR